MLKKQLKAEFFEFKRGICDHELVKKNKVMNIIFMKLSFTFKQVHHHPQPYAFGYSVKDHHGEQHREESGDGGNSVKGSYGFTDDRGVHRQVNYVADHGGFRAEIHTNEPGTANQDPAAVKIVSSAHNGYYGGHGIAASVIGGPIGGYAPVAIVGNHYSNPLHGGYVSVYDSRYSHV